MAFSLYDYIKDQQLQSWVNHYEYSDNTVDNLIGLVVAQLVSLNRQDNDIAYRHIMNLDSQDLVSTLPLSNIQQQLDSEHSEQTLDQLLNDISQTLFEQLKQILEGGNQDAQDLNELLEGQTSALAGRFELWVYQISELTALSDVEESYDASSPDDINASMSQLNAVVRQGAEQQANTTDQHNETPNTTPPKQTPIIESQATTIDTKTEPSAGFNYLLPVLGAMVLIFMYVVFKMVCPTCLG